MVEAQRQKVSNLERLIDKNQNIRELAFSVFKDIRDYLYKSGLMNDAERHLWDRLIKDPSGESALALLEFIRTYHSDILKGVKINDKRFVGEHASFYAFGVFEGLRAKILQKSTKKDYVELEERPGHIRTRYMEQRAKQAQGNIYRLLEQNTKAVVIHGPEVEPLDEKKKRKFEFTFYFDRETAVSFTVFLSKVEFNRLFGKYAKYWDVLNDKVEITGKDIKPVLNYAKPYLLSVLTPGAKGKKEEVSLIYRSHSGVLTEVVGIDTPKYGLPGALRILSSLEYLLSPKAKRFYANKRNRTRAVNVIQRVLGIKLGKYEIEYPMLLYSLVKEAQMQINTYLKRKGLKPLVVDGLAGPKTDKGSKKYYRDYLKYASK